MRTYGIRSNFLSLLCILSVALATGCTNLTRETVQDLELDAGRQTVPIVSLHKQLGHHLTLVGSARTWSGSDDSVLQLAAARPSEPPSVAGFYTFPGYPALAPAEFRYDDLAVAGHAGADSDGSSYPSRSFSANYKYRSVEASLLWTSSYTSRWFFEGGITAIFDHLSAHVREESPLAEPYSFSLAETAVSLAADRALGLRVSGPLTLKFRYRQSLSTLSDVESLELRLLADYAVNERIGLHAACFVFSREDNRDVSPIVLHAAGFELGAAFRF